MTMWPWRCVSSAGRTAMPSVMKIQRLIEAAWRQGYDHEGCQQLDAKLVNTTKWIGATDIVAMMASLGVRWAWRGGGEGWGGVGWGGERWGGEGSGGEGRGGEERRGKGWVGKRTLAAEVPSSRLESLGSLLFIIILLIGDFIERFRWAVI